jgi:hypothetical protein
MRVEVKAVQNGIALIVRAAVSSAPTIEGVVARYAIDGVQAVGL